MFFNLFIISCLVAFISLIWKETLNTFPALKNMIRKHLSVIARKPLFCGFCFTSWLALLVLIFVRIFLSLFLDINFFLAWATIALTAIFIRSVIIALEELVHWQVHTLNGQVDDLH